MRIRVLVWGVVAVFACGSKDDGPKGELRRYIASDLAKLTPIMARMNNEMSRVQGAQIVGDPETDKPIIDRLDRAIPACQELVTAARGFTIKGAELKGIHDQLVAAFTEYCAAIDAARAAIAKPDQAAHTAANERIGTAKAAMFAVMTGPLTAAANKHGVPPPK